MVDVQDLVGHTLDGVFALGAAAIGYLILRGQRQTHIMLNGQRASALAEIALLQKQLAERLPDPEAAARLEATAATLAEIAGQLQRIEHQTRRKRRPPEGQA